MLVTRIFILLVDIAIPIAHLLYKKALTAAASSTAMIAAIA